MTATPPDEAPTPAPAPRTWAIIDGLLAVLLWCVQAFLAFAAFILTASSVMITANCFDVRRCGDPDWIGWAMAVAVVGGVILLTLSGTLAATTGRRRSVASVVAAAGCVLQIVLTVIALTMAGQAGPLDH